MVLLGTSAFAAAVLQELAEGPHRPALVVTRPDAKQGRGRQVAPPPVADTARALGIDVLQPASVNDEATRAQIAAVAPEAVVLCAFGALVKDPLLSDHEILNIHPSLLPRWRGAAPVERAMMAGDAQTGVSIMRLVAALDAGPVYAQEAEEIRPDDDYASLAARLQARSVALLTRVLEQRPAPVEQPEDGVTYAEKLGADDRTLDPARPAAENVRVVHALRPHIGARIALPDGTFLGVHEARVGDEGALDFVTVQPAGGRAMAYADYLRGGRPGAGDLMAAASPARRAAVAVVRRVLEEGAYADRALHGEAKGLEPRERALAKRLAFGTVQRRGTLDWIVAAHVHRELDPPVRAALHLGLYQLLYTEVAPHAAVAESVEFAKPSPGAKLVNAVLRTVQRQGVELPPDTDPAGAAIVHAHPRWLVDLWWDWLGAEQTRALLAADNEPAELALRVNPLAGLEVSGLPTRPAEDDALIVEGPLDVLAHPLYAAGAITPQSRASQRVARIVDPQPGERILDLCAAPGGKTTHLAALMGDRGEIVAVERHARRAQALVAQCDRLHATSVRVHTADAAQVTVAELGGTFDRVLVDPPCSGLGTLQSHPDLRWRASPESIESLRVEQEAIVAAARSVLAPGGRLVYSTCTLSPREEVVTGEALHTFPHRDGTDGFYIAVSV